VDEEKDQVAMQPSQREILMAVYSEGSFTKK